MTLRHRTMKLGERLDTKARDRAWFEPPSSSEHKQAELDLPNDPKREFVVSIDTAHVRCSRSEKARIFEIAVARCGRGRRRSPPGHYFATAGASKHELRARTLQPLQREGYVGKVELTVISDGAEIMKRLPKALPRPTAHILDWFHIAMKIQPLQQVADHIATRNGPAISIADDIRSVKWKLWHGQREDHNRFGRSKQSLQTCPPSVSSISRSPCSPTFVQTEALSSITARATEPADGSASSLAESVIDSLVARRMVKTQQMQWSLQGVHRILQVRAAVLSGDLSNRSAWQPPKPTHDIAWRGCSSRPTTAAGRMKPS